MAVLSKNASLVKMLLAFGAKPDLQVRKNMFLSFEVESFQDARGGKTPIFLATELGLPGVVHLLVSFGARVTVANYVGVIPSSVALDSRSVDGGNTSQPALGVDYVRKYRSRIK